MSFLKRKIFFYFLSFAFIALGGGIVLYSQGYRFNAADLAIEKIGAIFVRSNPVSANISLNNNRVKNKSWLLASGTLINNLVPGMYTLGLEEGGYLPWKKTLVVSPSLVTEVESIVLIKDQPPALKLTGVADAWLAGGKLIIKKGDGRITYAKEGGEKDGILPGDTFVELSEDKKFAITLDSKNTYFLTNIGNEKSSLNVNLFFENLKMRALAVKGDTKINHINFEPGGSGKIFIGTEKSVYLLDIDASSITRLENSGIANWDMGRSELIWKNGKNELWEYRFSYGDKKILLSDASALKKAVAYPNSDKYAAIVLGKDKTLSLISTASSSAEMIANRAVLFQISPDKQKMVFVDDDGAINIKYLSTDKNISFRLPIRENIASLAWFKDSEHLILGYADDKIYFTEIDGLNPVNTYHLGNARKYFYEPDMNILFLFADGNLSEFKFD